MLNPSKCCLASRPLTSRWFSNSKPPDENQEDPKKKSVPSAKSFASRWHRRSLNPTARLVAMLPKEDQPTIQANKITENKPKIKRKLSPEDRLKALMNDDNKETKS